MPLLLSCLGSHYAPTHQLYSSKWLSLRAFCLFLTLSILRTYQNAVLATLRTSLGHLLAGLKRHFGLQVEIAKQYRYSSLFHLQLTLSKKDHAYSITKAELAIPRFRYHLHPHSPTSASLPYTTATSHSLAFHTKPLQSLQPTNAGHSYCQVVIPSQSHYQQHHSNCKLVARVATSRYFSLYYQRRTRFHLQIVEGSK